MHREYFQNQKDMASPTACGLTICPRHIRVRVWSFNFHQFVDCMTNKKTISSIRFGLCFNLLSSGRLTAHVFLRITEKVYHSPILLGLFRKPWESCRMRKIHAISLQDSLLYATFTIYFFLVTFIIRLCHAVAVILRYSWWTCIVEYFQPRRQQHRK